MSTSETTPASSKPAASKTAWKQAKVHKGITLPSGTVVDIKIPSLSELIAAGRLPNNLVETATRQANPGAPVTEADLKSVAEYHRFLVAEALVKPEVTVEDVPELPTEDVDVLVEFATRRRDTDVVGHHIGGLETDARFRDFRGLEPRLPGVLGS